LIREIKNIWVSNITMWKNESLYQNDTLLHPMPTQYEEVPYKEKICLCSFSFSVYTVLSGLFL